jgi:hypothetical protein
VAVIEQHCYGREMIDSHSEDHTAAPDPACDAELKRLIERTHRRMKWTLIAAVTAAILSAIAVLAVASFFVIAGFMLAGSGGD